MKWTKRPDHNRAVVLAVLLAVGRLTAGFQFEFACRGDTVQRVEPGGVAEFGFVLTNTGTEPDVYEFDCRVIQAVPGWTAIFCLHGQCSEPGTLMFDTLDAGATDTAISITVFTTSAHGEEVVGLRVRSLGDAALAESVATRTVASSGITEDRPQPAAGCPRPGASVTRGSLFTAGEGDLFDALGRRVAVLEPGSNRVGRLPSGVYLFRPGTGDRPSAVKVAVQD